MVRPEIVHLELGSHLRSQSHPHSMPLPRGLAIRRDDIERLAGVIVMVGVRRIETLNGDVSLVRDQRGDKYLRFPREQRCHSIEWGIRNLTRVGGGLGIRVAPLERELYRVHFVLKLERYTGDLGGERSDDSF